MLRTGLLALVLVVLTAGSARAADRYSYAGGCYSVAGLKHRDYGCERFASELAWAYWSSPDNTMRPTSASDEAAGMPVAQFRALLAQLLGAPSIASAPQATKAYAPASKKRRRR